MALKIRLARAGAKKRPDYRIVVADLQSPREDAEQIQKLGTYDPLQPRGSAERIRFSEGRVQHWLGVGAQPHRPRAPLPRHGRIKKRDGRSNPQRGQPGKKRLEREEAKKRAAEEKAKAAAEAASAPAPGPEPEPAAEAEAPAAEAETHRVALGRESRPRAAR